MSVGIETAPSVEMRLHIVEIEVAFTLVDAVLLKEHDTLMELLRGESVGAADGISPRLLSGEELVAVIVGHDEEIRLGRGEAEATGIGTIRAIGIIRAIGVIGGRAGAGIDRANTGAGGRGGRIGGRGRIVGDRRMTVGRRNGYAFRIGRAFRP